jgi:hypothetical protein
MRSTVRAVLLLALIAAPALAGDNSWIIGPRTLPPPANASPELQAILTAEPTPKLKFMHGDPPTELFVWKELIAL